MTECPQSSTSSAIQARSSAIHCPRSALRSSDCKRAEYMYCPSSGESLKAARSRERSRKPAVTITASASHSRSETLRMRPVSDQRQAVDLDQRVLGQPRHLDRRARRRRIAREVLAVDRVHGREVVHALQEHVALDDLREIAAR